MSSDCNDYYRDNSLYNEKEAAICNISVGQSGVFRKIEITSFHLSLYTEEVPNTD